GRVDLVQWIHAFFSSDGSTGTQEVFRGIAVFYVQCGLAEAGVDSVPGHAGQVRPGDTARVRVPCVGIFDGFTAT
ncbi:hypothetical protein C4E44_24450, partial [Pseudomonas sp. MWU12-2312b]